jgi:alkylresorcinol/alkylpyrone synthase
MKETSMNPKSSRSNAPVVSGIGVSLPPHRVDQNQARQAICGLWDSRGVDYDGEWVEYFFEAIDIDQRYLALEPAEYAEIHDFGAANDHYIRVATDLGAEAVDEALTQAGLARDELDAIFFTTVTGVASPSIDAKIINRLGLPRRIVRTPMFGLGCVGGAAGLGRMASYLRAYPDQAAVLLSVELCSLTVEREAPSIADYIAAALFADGAAAVAAVGADKALANEQKTKPSWSDRPRMIDSASAFYHDTEWVMGWDIDQSGFGLVLSGDLPDVIERELGDEVDGFLDGHGLARSDVRTWISHPGGPKVLEAIESALSLDDDALASAWGSLAEVGNLSSASVLHVLQKTLDGGDFESPGLLLAMGPGFSAEFVLLD